MQMMKPGHHRWQEFVDRLSGPEGVDFQGNPEDPGTWTNRCSGGSDLAHSRAILQRMGLNPPEIEATVEYFRHNGGYCDCEVLMNVDPAQDDEEEDG